MHNNNEFNTQNKAIKWQKVKAIEETNRTVIHTIYVYVKPKM